MAGKTGPVPERSEDVIRRNERDPITKIPVIGTVEVPELGITNAHPLVKELYESMAESGQSRYYEPSDWQYARMTMHFVNKLLKKSNPSAMMLTTVNQMLTALLLTEGDRRRVRIEVERSPVGPVGDNVIDAQSAFKLWLEEP